MFEVGHLITEGLMHPRVWLASYVPSGFHIGSYSTADSYLNANTYALLPNRGTHQYTSKSFEICVILIKSLEELRRK